MAGTGNLDVLRIARQLRKRHSPDVPYGSHMAVHMAVGLLFLGGGRCGNSFCECLAVSSSTHFPVLVYVLVRALNRYGRGHGFVSRTSLIFFFSGFLFAIAKLASLTAITGGSGSQPTGSQIIWLCIRIYHKINTNVKMQINSYLI